MNAKPEARLTLRDYWDVHGVSEDGVLEESRRSGFMFSIDGMDGSFLTPEQITALHNDWRSLMRLMPNEEIQLLFSKRVDFASWIEEQLNQAFLSENSYGRKILTERLADQVARMSAEEPRLLSQKIIGCFWTGEKVDDRTLDEKRRLVHDQFGSFGFRVEALNKAEIEREIHSGAQGLDASRLQEPEWPLVKIEAGRLKINGDRFRAMEMVKLPETFTEFGMIQALTGLPYPMDICVRLKARETRPIVARLERKRNLLEAQRSSKNSPMPLVESQVDQIDQILRSLADSSESVFELKMTVGFRFPENLDLFQSKAMGTLLRAASQMDFCEFEEVTLSAFDSYLECIPGFRGRNIKSHTVLTSNAVHCLPFFRPAKGDERAVATFQTRDSSLYGIDPVAPRLANYNWLVSGTSGSGKSFFVNSLLAQSTSIDPNIFIVDIGGSYNKLTQFLGGRTLSLEPGRGFELSPFFLGQSGDPNEERMRRQHTLQIFLEMARLDGRLPALSVRHFLSEILKEIFDMDRVPERPVTHVLEIASKSSSAEAKRLTMLLQPWAKPNFFGQFLDNNKSVITENRILTFDLKGLTEFEDLSRVVQLIVCAGLWAQIRRSGGGRFSWIVLDEVAFSLLKTQPGFVDELISTLRKYYAGAIVVVQDLEKVTSNLAGSSILQNAQSKAILQQRGNPKNYSEVLSLNQIDLWAIESLRREKGSFSDIFLIRDHEKTVIRHVPSDLEYWLATTAPEDGQEFKKVMDKKSGSFQEKVIEFAHTRRRVNP